MPSCIFSGALICSFIWVIFFLSWHTYYIVRGGALGIRQCGATHMAACGAVCGGGVRVGTMPLGQVLSGFQSLPLLPTSKLGPSGAESQVSWFVYILGPHGSLQQSLP